MFACLRRKRSDPGKSSADAPFPYRQLAVLALCRICEPIAFMSIFPYIYYMIVSFEISSDSHQIAIYAGMVTSAFAFAEFSTGMLWGRLSDVVGRKPVLLTGMAGTGVSMLVFGFAPNLKIALLARALGGILNGNIGVLQTTVAELVTAKEHQAFAFAIMPAVWCIGSIIGSGLGGILAEPVKNHPNSFSPDGIFARFPFLLPNLVCVAVVIFGLLIGILFLEETHEKKKARKDPGLELGSWILRTLCGNCLSKESHDEDIRDKDNFEEMAALVEEDMPPEYCSNESTPRVSGTHFEEDIFSQHAKLPLQEEIDPVKPKHSVQRIFTKQIILCVVAYGVLAYHTISFEQLLPVLLSMEHSTSPAQLPFKFTGGFELPSSTVGYILSFQGLYQIPAQLIFFPKIVKIFGPLKTFRFVALTYAFLYLLTPYLTLLPSALRWPALFLILVWKVTYQALSYPSLILILTNSAPSTLVLGAVNGVGASTASLARAFGPTVSGAIQSAGLSMGYMGLAWWAVSAIAALGALESLCIRNPPSLCDTSEKECKEMDYDIDEASDDFADDRRSVSTTFSTTSEETLVDDDDSSTWIEDRVYHKG